MGRKNRIYSRKMNPEEQPFSVPTFTIPVTSLEDIDTEPEPVKVELVEQEQAPTRVEQDPIMLEQEPEKVEDTNSIDKEDNKDINTVDTVKTENYVERYSFSACIIF